jgi:hypothetical protein
MQHQLRRRQRERQILAKFVEKYSLLSSAEYSIIAWPEDENRNTKECECLAEAHDNASVLAIEHTEVETFTGQKKDNSDFSRVLTGWADELSWPNFCIRIFVPTFALKKGSNWKQVSESLRQFISTSAENLPFGSQDHTINGIPFPVTIQKLIIEHGSGVSFGRFAPARGADEELVDDFVRALREKRLKFANYSDPKYRRILLIESQDYALTSTELLYKCYRRACQTETAMEIDEIWLLRTFESTRGTDHMFFCFRGPVELCRKANGLADVGPDFDQYYV